MSDEGLTVRDATEADGPLLAALELSAPLVFGDSSITIDRGHDYFAAARLMGDYVALLAEIDGEPAGVLCGAGRRAPIGGLVRRLVYVHHARIPPAFQGRGVGRELSAQLLKHLRFKEIDSQYWYVSPENARSQAFVARAENKWSFGPVQARIECSALAGPPAGRAATPADAREIVAILNSCHMGEEMFLPYTAESFAARMERDPGQYSWKRVWLSEGAVVGVWPLGESISVRSRHPDGRETIDRGAAVLDYGFLPGAETEFLDLLGAWCGWLLARGMTSLEIFTSEYSPTWGSASKLPATFDPIDLWTPGIPEPVDAAAHGLYVDRAFF
jgi:ribosomal protein S18 acetylase RimI-like enzyme